MRRWAAAALVTAAAGPSAEPAQPPPSAWDIHARGAASAMATETLWATIEEHQVVILSQSSCKSSAKVKSFFEDLGIAYYALELDQREDGPALTKALAQTVPKAGVPRIFIGGEHAGGASEIAAAYSSGELAHWVERDGDDDDDVIVVAAT